MTADMREQGPVWKLYRISDDSSAYTAMPYCPVCGAMIEVEQHTRDESRYTCEECGWEYVEKER